MIDERLESLNEEALTKEIEENINAKIQQSFTPNRAARRAQAKANKKKNKNKKIFLDTVQDAAERMTYIKLIERLKKENEKLEKEGEKKNEAAN